jgi:hypothetical protein
LRIRLSAAVTGFVKMKNVAFRSKQFLTRRNEGREGG